MLDVLFLLLLYDLGLDFFLLLLYDLGLYMKMNLVSKFVKKLVEESSLDDEMDALELEDLFFGGPKEAGAAARVLP